MIDDEKIEAALEYLATHVDAAAEACANRVYMMEARKTKKALLMNQANEDSEAAKERYAYSHPEYEALLKKLKAAVLDDKKHELRRKAYDATIEAWRTQQANIRAAEKVT